MSNTAVSSRIQNVLGVSRPFLSFFNDSRYAQHKNDPGISDFVFGNPHEMPLPGFVNALKKQIEPQNKDWYAYKQSETSAQETVVNTLRHTHQMAFKPEDVFMTNGAFGAIATTLSAITDPGDEIMYISPPWFFYEPMIVMNQGKAVRVPCNPQTLDLDLNAIAAAITPHTRAIMINSPNNPTGKIYPPETLESLSMILTRASQKNGRTIYLLSDESYNHIVYDGLRYPSPTSYYPASFLLYTYGKTLLTPGQRIGYVALPPNMPDRDQVAEALFMAQVVTAYAFPNALLQHALPDLENLSINIEVIAARRDHMLAELTRMGYQTHRPEGTFYLLVRSPLEDDLAFCELLADENIYVLPGSTYEMPGTFRISLTANDEMIEKALPGFLQAFERAAAQGQKVNP